MCNVQLRYENGERFSILAWHSEILFLVAIHSYPRFIAGSVHVKLKKTPGGGIYQTKNCIPFTADIIRE